MKLAQPLSVLLSLAAAPLADTEVYGCTNPAGSLAVLSGEARLGSTVLVGLDNPLGTQAPGAATLLAIAPDPDAAFPCGSPVPGFGMAGGGAPGELLVLNPVLLLPGPAWTGAGSPALFPLAVPVDAALLGVDLYAQGAIVDPAAIGTAGAPIGLTEAVRLTIEAACGGLAPCVDITSIDRLASAGAYGYDYEFDDGAEEKETDDSAVGTWSADPDLDFEDWWGFPVASASADHTSRVGGALIDASFGVSAASHGNHFIADGGGTARLDVTFDATERARFQIDTVLVTTDGYNEARSRLATAAGLTIHSMFVIDGDEDEDGHRGWLQVGGYTLEVLGEASAGGTHGHPSAGSASIDWSIAITHQADMDHDGDVDQADQDAFDHLHGLGSAAADIDGDGDTDAQDEAIFDAAWNAVQ